MGDTALKVLTASCVACLIVAILGQCVICCLSFYDKRKERRVHVSRENINP